MMASVTLSTEFNFLPEYVCHLYDSKFFSDCCLVCQDGRVLSHRAILATWSPLLHDAFKLSSEDISNEMVDVFLPEFTKSDVFQMLKCCYGHLTTDRCATSSDLFQCLKIDMGSKKCHDNEERVFEVLESRTVTTSKRKRLSLSESPRSLFNFEEDAQNVCARCDEQFSTQIALFVHYKSHFVIGAVMDNSKTVCIYCEKPKGLYSMFRHLNACKGLFSCEKCLRKFPHDNELLMHFKDHYPAVDDLGENISICPYCEEQFQVTDLRQHINTFHLVHSPKYKANCSVCCLKFYNQVNYEKHLETSMHKHNISIAEGKLPQNSVQNTAEITGRSHYKNPFNQGFTEIIMCERCQFVFESEKNLFLHYNSHYTLEYHEAIVSDTKEFAFCIYCDCVQPLSDMKKHILSEHLDQNLYCQTCEIYCLNKKHLERHILKSVLHSKSLRSNQEDPLAQYRVVQNKRPVLLKCSQCSLEMKSEKAFYIHLLTHVPEKDRNPPPGVGILPGRTYAWCPECRRMYLAKTMYSHRAYFHDSPHGFSRFYCKMCNKYFSTQPDIEVHLRLPPHVDECDAVVANFICHQCGQTFFREKALNDHIRYKHQGYLCKICNVTYKSHGALQTHRIKVHNSIKNIYTCETCGLTYHFRHLLNKHNFMKHSNEFKSACRFCNKSFKLPYLCNYHEAKCRHRTNTVVVNDDENSQFKNDFQ